MDMYQDGVKVYWCVGYCSADEEHRDPNDLDDCPIGEEYCSGDCYYYREDLHAEDDL